MPATYPRARFEPSNGTRRLPWKGLVEVKKYVVTYERDENSCWSAVVKISSRETAISDGQTLPKARRRIRQAVAVALDVPEDSFELVDAVQLPAAATRALKRYRETQSELERWERDAERVRHAVASELDRLGISRRDTGDLLGLSGARVQQLLDEAQ